MVQELRPDIIAAKENMGLFAWKSLREANRLGSYLRQNEQVIAMAGGIYGNGGGLVALTDQRLMFIKDGWFSKTSQDFALSRISSIEWKSGLFRGKMIIFGDGEPDGVIIDKVWNQSGNIIVAQVRERSGRNFAGFPTTPTTASMPLGSAQPQQPAESSAAILDRLAALDRMRESLGAERYEALRDKILRGE